jgi:hypothetical protein
MLLGCHIKIKKVTNGDINKLSEKTVYKKIACLDSHWNRPVSD